MASLVVEVSPLHLVLSEHSLIAGCNAVRSLVVQNSLLISMVRVVGSESRSASWDAGTPGVVLTDLRGDLTEYRQGTEFRSRPMILGGENLVNTVVDLIPRVQP